jgi:hypothetical protein
MQGYTETYCHCLLAFALWFVGKSCWAGLLYLFPNVSNRIYLKILISIQNCSFLIIPWLVCYSNT